MKNIDHNYWIGKYAGKDADLCNPDLRITMQELYGRKGFDFGKVRYTFYDEDRNNHCVPDGYSTLAVLNHKYRLKMPFRHEVIKNNEELSKRCHFLAGTIAGEFFFPAHRLGGNTVNQARGCNRGINDMVYLTLESIKNYYYKKSGDYPIRTDLERYGFFFDSFASFDEYIEYNLLQDYGLLPKKYPTNESELIDFWKKSIDFFEARSKRIEEYAIRNSLLE